MQLKSGAYLCATVYVGTFDADDMVYRADKYRDIRAFTPCSRSRRWSGSSIRTGSDFRVAVWHQI